MAVFSSGRDALSVVAEETGFWNWVFIGSDASTLPLIDGGSGSIKEMQGCLEQHDEHAVIFGLLRLRFGTGSLARNKHVFIVASNEDSPNFKALQVGTAMSQRGAVEKEFGSYCNMVATVEVKRASDLVLGSIVAAVREKMTVDGDHAQVQVDLSEDAAEASLEEMKRVRRTTVVVDSEGEDEPTKGIEEAVVVDEDDKEYVKELQEQTEKLIRYTQTQMGVVDTPSKARSETLPGEAWNVERAVALDANEMRFAQKGLLLDKYNYDSLDKAVAALNLGERSAAPGYSVAWNEADQTFYLLYRQGRSDAPLHFKQAGMAAAQPVSNDLAHAKQQIMLSHMAADHSIAPEEPPRFSGLLYKQSTGFFSEWQVRAFEVSRGRVCYWADWASKTAGSKPKYDYSLLNAAVELVKSSDSRFQLTLKENKSASRAPYILMANICAKAGSSDAKHQHVRDDWVLALVQHAVYAKKVLAYKQATQMFDSANVRRDRGATC